MARASAASHKSGGGAGGQEMGGAISKFDKLAAQLREAKKLERGNKLKSDKHEPRERER